MKHRIEKNLLLRSIIWTAALGATVFAADWLDSYRIYPE